MVRDAHLDHRAVPRAELDDQLGRQERPTRLDPDALERFPPEELAGAVDVGRAEAEEDPVGEAIALRVQGPDERVRPLDPEADDHVGPIRPGHPSRQSTEVGDPELAVPVGEGHEPEAGRPEARAQRGAVAQVDLVVDGPDDAGMRGHQPLGDLRRPIASSRRPR